LELRKQPLTRVSALYLTRITSPGHTPLSHNMSHPCEAKCGRYFTSIKSMNSHLTSAKSCSWYPKERLRELGVNDINEEVSLSLAIPPDLQVHGHVEFEGEEGDGWEAYDPQQDPDIAMEFGPYEDEFRFLPDEPEDIGVDNHIYEGSRHMVLDDKDDKRITIVDEDAGRILRHEKEAPQVDREGDTLMEEGGEPNTFAPFSSELDWRVAQWAVKDGPGHNAFNRFLEIPEVNTVTWMKFHASFLMLSRLLRSLAFRIITFEVSIKS
jgi:hypothetical protein